MPRCSVSPRRLTLAEKADLALVRGRLPRIPLVVATAPKPTPAPDPEPEAAPSEE